jgi:hypothetical protein
MVLEKLAKVTKQNIEFFPGTFATLRIVVGKNRIRHVRRA